MSRLDPCFDCWHPDSNPWRQGWKWRSALSIFTRAKITDTLKFQKKQKKKLSECTRDLQDQSPGCQTQPCNQILCLQRKDKLSSGHQKFAQKKKVRVKFPTGPSDTKLSAANKKNPAWKPKIPKELKTIFFENQLSRRQPRRCSSVGKAFSVWCNSSVGSNHETCHLISLITPRHNEVRKYPSNTVCCRCRCMIWTHWRVAPDWEHFTDWATAPRPTKIYWL